MWRNTRENYGLVTIALHWLIAVVVIGLFGLGLWMVELDYYHPWYRRGPELHKGFGILLFGLMLVRMIWRYTNPRPAPAGTPLEQRVARWVHLLSYVLLFALMVSGYLISTADGRAIEVFDWFSVPATLQGIDRQEDIAGEAHEVLAFVLIGLVCLHVAGALKHHFVDGDRTLQRIFGIRS